MFWQRLMFLVVTYGLPYDQKGTAKIASPSYISGSFELSRVRVTKGKITVNV